MSSYMLHPRQQQKANFRANLTAAITPQFDVSISSGFGQSHNIIEPDNSAIIGLLYTGQANFGYKGCPAGTEKSATAPCGLDKPFYDPTGFPLHDYNLFSPGSVM